MAEDNILKGVFKEGPLVATVIQKPESARIMLKGAEPSDPAFKDQVKKAAEGCKAHIEKFASRELCAVTAENAAAAESVAVGEEDLKSMGLTGLSVMDANCGVPIRVVEAEPAPTPLPYGSLRSANGLPDQPGIVEIPPEFPRKTYNQLSDPQKKVFETAAQVAGRGLLRIVCFEDGGLKCAVTVRDMPPPRGRSVLVPLSELADLVAKGTSLDEIGKKLQQLRT
jgi:hypothetical protein